MSFSPWIWNRWSILTWDMLKSLWLPSCFSGKESTCNAGVAGDLGLIRESGRSPGGEHGNPIQYSFFFFLNFLCVYLAIPSLGSLIRYQTRALWFGSTRVLATGPPVKFPLQYSCLQNHMVRGAWWATVHGVSKSPRWRGWACVHAIRVY